MKKVISISSAILSAFLILFAVQYLSVIQVQEPFETEYLVVLEKTEEGISKERIISDLNELSDVYETTLLKTSNDVDNYINKKDVFWFGAKKPKAGNPIVQGNSIFWLEHGQQGELLHSNDIGSRSLNGLYSYKSNKAGFLDALRNWGQSNGVKVSDVPKTAFLKDIFGSLIFRGAGGGVLSSIILLITAIVTWFFKQAKARAIRLLGGISELNIHMQDSLLLLRMILIGMSISFLAVLTYVYLFRAEQLGLVLRICIMPLLVQLLFSIAIITVLSWLVRPKTEQIANRTIPYKTFSGISQINRVIATFLAILIIPSSLQMAITSYKLMQEYSLWETKSSMIQLSFNDFDAFLSESMKPETERFFESSFSDGNLQLSYVLDKGVLMSRKLLGKYDHVIITDNAWVRGLRISEEDNSRGELARISFNDIHDELRSFLDVQIGILTTFGSAQSEKISYYEYTGGTFIALPPGGGVSNETVHAKRPLVILVENPLDVFDLESFILPVASSGNLVFSDMDLLKKALNDSKIKPYISSIDNTAERALQSAQEFRQEAIYYLLSCVIIIVVIIAVNILSASIWSVLNRNKIFSLHTFGYSIDGIIAPALKKNSNFAITILILGSFLSYSLTHTNIRIVAVVALIVAIAQRAGRRASYSYFSQLSFTKSINRKFN